MHTAPPHCRAVAHTRAFKPPSYSASTNFLASPLGSPRPTNQRPPALLFFFQAEDGIRDADVTGVQRCALPIFHRFASPRTVDALLRALPVGGRAAIWGEEVYFQVSVQAAGESPRNKLEVGSIAYWPMGSAVCVFFGPTKPYSPVNMIGRVTANLELFRKVREGTTVTIKKA